MNPSELKYPTNDKKVIDLEPCFFDPEKFAWTAMLRSELPVIKKELETYINSQGMDAFIQGYPTLVDGSWKALALTFWKLRRPYYTLFPNTFAIFEKIPYCTALSFSRLTAGSVIKPHFGENNAYYRCHLGLDVPATLPDVGFKVGAEERSWEEGGVLIFNDAKMHSAFNFSDQQRTIIIFDVWREEYLHCFKGNCSPPQPRLVQKLPLV
jgi:aspartyl/asparaginyl beta-hydroxylase (cupin superfamily)